MYLAAAGSLDRPLRPTPPLTGQRLRATLGWWTPSPTWRGPPAQHAALSTTAPATPSAAELGAEPLLSCGRQWAPPSGGLPASPPGGLPAAPAAGQQHDALAYGPHAALVEEWPGFHVHYTHSACYPPPQYNTEVPRNNAISLSEHAEHSLACPIPRRSNP